MSEELRDAIAGALTAPMETWTGGPDSAYWLARADALLSGPLAPLLAAQAAVERVRELADPRDHGGLLLRAELRRALDGTP